MDQSENTSHPDIEPTQEFVSARARRRRAQRRAYFPTDEEGRAALFTYLAKRAFPSYELFIFALVAGTIIGLGYFLDSQALLIFGVLVSPLLTPWIGISLAIVAGAGRLFAQTTAAFVVSSFLFFTSGLLAGFATRISETRTYNEIFVHSRLWWPDLVVLAIGAIIITLSFVRSEQRPYLPSALIAYEFFLPLSAAGFGLGSGVEGVWPQGVLVFLVHFAWATLFCILTLFFLRFYPISIAGISFTAITLIILIGWLGFSTGAVNWLLIKTGQTMPPPEPFIETTPTLALIPTFTLTSTSTSVPVTPIFGVDTLTPSRTPTAKPTTIKATEPPTESPTPTITAEATPIVALIKASEGGGAFIREKPGGKVLVTLGNGSSVVIVPNDLQDVNNVIWVHVFTTYQDKRVEGWMIQSVLVTATPLPDWLPSSTPTITPNQ